MMLLFSLLEEFSCHLEEISSTGRSFLVTWKRFPLQVAVLNIHQYIFSQPRIGIQPDDGQQSSAAATEMCPVLLRSAEIGNAQVTERISSSTKARDQQHHELHLRACTRPTVGDTWVAAPPVFGHRRTSSSSGERQTTTARRTSNQSRGERWPGGPADHPEAVEWLGKARGGATAPSSCMEAAAGVGAQQAWLEEGIALGEAELLVCSGRTEEARRRQARARKRRRSGRRQPRFPSGRSSCAEAAAGGKGEAAGDLQAAAGAPPAWSLADGRIFTRQDLRGRWGEEGRRWVTLQRA